MAILTNRSLILSIVLLGFYSSISYSRPPATQEGIKKTFVLMVNKIKHGCNAEHPTDDAAFKVCAQTRYDAMHSFYEKLFKYRDTKGIKSKEFLYSLDCINKHAPEVNEPDRKYAVELTDWEKANQCYENALK